MNMIPVGVWSLLLLLSVPFVACAQAGGYSIKDSDVTAGAKGVVYWLDNRRVVFSGVKTSPQSRGPLMFEEKVWDTATGTVAPFPALDGLPRLCIRGEFISYIRQSLDADSGWVVVYGKLRGNQIIEEQSTPLQNPYQMNPFSCRYYSPRTRGQRRGALPRRSWKSMGFSIGG